MSRPFITCPRCGSATLSVIRAEIRTAVPIDPHTGAYELPGHSNTEIHATHLACDKCRHFAPYEMFEQAAIEQYRAVDKEMTATAMSTRETGDKGGPKYNANA